MNDETNETPSSDELAQRRTRKAKPKVTETQAVLLEIEAERKAQDARWGEQNHAQQGGDVPAKAIAHYNDAANSWKRINDERVGKGNLGWDGILLEEVYEALAETDPAKRRAELVQVAAVAACAIECIDRNEGPDKAAA